MITRFFVAIVMAGSILGACGTPGAPPQTAVTSQQPAPQQQEEFVPIDQLPPQDQLPAAPLLVTAYSFVVLALFAYLISVARRLGVVQRELDRLQSDARRGHT
jgi:CcmD family protein